MPSTRRQKAKAKKSREMDMIFVLDNLDIMIGSENITPIERELTNTIGESTAKYETESNSHPRGNCSQENEFKDFGHENAILRRD